MKEYSYFRADGLSLEALETVTEARAEVKALSRKLCDKFGANDFIGGYRDELGRFQFVVFQFLSHQEVPEGWDIRSRQKDAGGNVTSTFAMPAPGSPDAFHMASMGGLMERASRRSSLEGVFNCGEMPMRAHPAGSFETAFVRQALMRGDPGPKGQVYGSGIPIGGSSSPGTVADPLFALELDGKTYIRVPNKPGTEEPQIVPPDAIPVSYEEMLAADKAEMARRTRSFPPDFCCGC